MNVALRATMTRDEFLAWAEAEDGRFEFDGVRPVAMTGGTMRHSMVSLNINAGLAARLRGASCRPLGNEAGVATIGDAVRYPDAVVSCSPIDYDARLAPAPVVVFEVVSPGSGFRDRIVKLREYQALPSILRYAIVELDAVAVLSYGREAGTQPFQVAALGEGDMLGLPEIGIQLPLAEIYAGLAP